MKREIKFRGKRIDNGEWVVGNLVMVCDGESLRRYPCIVISYNHDTFDWFEVHPDSVGQFTGIYDKNGKEIYEGDIVGTSYGKKGVVVYDDARACFILHDSQHFNVQLFQELPSIMIIGNIFENPELLEK